MADLRLVTYCGLYCGLCSNKNRIPRKAQELQDTMRKEGYERWAQEIPGFKPFWEFLSGLAKGGPGGTCREGTCGAPFCAIRKCARGKKIDICVECAEYPCKKIAGVAKGYPTLLADGKRMKEIGVEAWIKEQEERAGTGFAYVDIRCYPYEVPDK
jgi:hypothetical protein